MKRKRQSSRKRLGKEHRRVEPTVSIKLADIDVGPFDRDPQAISLFRQQFSGKIRIGLTRLSLSKTSTGFFARRNGRTVHVSNLNSEHVATVAANIRGGWRPQLSIYWNALAPTKSEYVCPDDEITLAAYRELNIGIVPCSILRPRALRLGDAFILIEHDGEYPRLARAISPNLDTVAMMKIEKGETFSRQIKRLVRFCADTRENLKTFHLSEFESTHYHHVLYAMLRRHERILNSISRLVLLHRAEHAAVLVRVAYEAFLNFYVDWISPSFFGPRLQLLGAISEASIAKNSKFEAHPSFAALTTFAQFLSRTANKARISPLGAVFHKRVYPSLSLVSHQTYGNIEPEANDFSDEERIDHPGYIEYLGQSLNIITMALLKRVRNEIGSDL